ncbi:tRNA 2-thiouridine synthesizing protein E [Bathymodiolus japonicus methanotrophic gill symbiont]|uniref:TusE/DsrC/DsvC family sulfur relay protein n=1 Tax=Bathymodiolus japonicus methanotrophic gill symbiont TaxID=113269 RepID=UPI001B7B3176|nr:TusE/DsrC/DsvC family sulfur relay protein [Bathymodiolus japonicus methanotrophic gill symbiont]GFO70932.1 tRNA 2-thiouridine synthesizing protein E [Bathymodiolus japonicus methanotrophic gill symbiont]
MELVLHGIRVAINEQGFLLDMRDWNEQLAVHLADIEGIVLTEAHWEILHFIRGFYLEYKYLPNARVFSKAIKNQLGADKANSRYLLKLFPEGPLKYSCKIAGLPKPPSCM